MDKAFSALGNLIKSGSDMVASGSSIYGDITSAGNSADDLSALLSISKLSHGHYDDHETHGGYGGYGGHGGHGGGYKGDPDCCPLVVDPLALASLIGFIGAATALLNTVIT